MKRSFIEFLQDILEAIAEIESFMVSVNFVDFRVNREKVLAVVKLLEVIGEAVKKIPQDKRQLYPNIPWQAIAGMRDILVHEYWEIDVEVVWATVKDALPTLKMVILRMLSQEDEIK